MKKILGDYIVMLFMFAAILLLTIRLPAGVVDVAIIINISLSVTTLVTTMTIRKPLEFSILPSLLLIITLFRLGINVSTTRNILIDRGASDLVIKTLGDSVLRGNVVVGLIILLIIILMQFTVIAEGVERVAEIAARFNLDAIPDRQMVVDANLSFGLIDEQQAKERREKIQRETDLCGVIDGTTRIVENDTVISFITTTINLTGGSTIGYIQSGDNIGNVLSTYSIMTMGDGLVGQIPALLIPAATGMTITRAVSKGSLNEDVSKQFLAQPRAIMIGGVTVAVLTVIPGIPAVQLALTSAGLLSGGCCLTKRTEEGPSLIAESAYQDAKAVIPRKTAHQETVVSGDATEGYYKNINDIYMLLTVGLVEVESRYSLIPLVDEPVGGRFISHIMTFHRQYAQSMGFVIPPVRLRNSSGPSINQCCIKIKGEGVAQGEILVDHHLALEPDQLEWEVDGIETVELVYGIPSRWTKPEDREKTEPCGYTVIDPLFVMVTRLSEVIEQHVYELTTRQEVVHLVENTKKTAPELVEEAFPDLISYSLLRHILTSLPKEGAPIKDLETIIETMVEVVSETGLLVKDTDSIVERIRTALKRTITCMYCEGGTMKVTTLDSELGRTMVDSLSKGEGRYYLALDSGTLQNIIGQMTEQLRRFDGLAQNPVVLASQVIRVYFCCLVEQFYPNVRVPSLNGTMNNVQVQSIGGLRLEAPMGRRV